MVVTETHEVAPTPSANGLYRLRTAIIVAMMAVVALAAGDIFDQTIWWFLAAPAVTGVIAIAMAGVRWPWFVAASLAGVVITAAATVLLTGGEAADISRAFAAGPQRLLTTDWPSPDRPDLIGTITLGLGLITAIATFMTRRRSLHLTPLLAVVVAQTCVIALSSPIGLRLGWMLPLALLALVFAALRPGDGTGVRVRLTILRGERRLFPVSVISIGLALVVASALVLTDRADPRRNEPAELSAALLDPIEATLSLRALDPSVDLHEVTIIADSGGRAPQQWRTTALVDYDGARWAPDLTLRPIGRRLEARGPDTIDATVSFLEPELQLVPLPGAPVVVDASIETDAEHNIVRLVNRPAAGTVISISARQEVDLAEVDPGQIATREIDENAAGLTDVANALAEQGGAEPGASLLEQLQAIEATLRNDFVLRSDASGGGLQRALIERFLRDTQRGNAEQFSTSFVLLARSLGADARVATGFVLEPGALQTTNGATTATLTSADATIWPEIRVGDDWVSFDPVPPNETSDATEDVPDPQEQTPAAAQPPIAPPPESADEPIVTETDDGSEAGTSLPVIVSWAFRTAAVGGALLIPLLLAIGLVLGVKWRRRRRQLSGSADERIMGAWTVATNRLVDAGMTIEQSDTNNEIADDATPHLEHAHREVHRLATLASASTFGSPARTDLLAADAQACLNEIEASLAASRTPLQRLRWRLSLRSLRRNTSSPV